jgi:hypothetical protein
VRIIGLCGLKGSGKTTSFQIIKEFLPSCIEIQLAKKLKDTLSSSFDINRSDFDDPILKESEFKNRVITLNNKNLSEVIISFNYQVNFSSDIRPHLGAIMDSPRRLMQYVGTEILRNIDPLVHLKSATNDLSDGLYVLTDLRFNNEFRYLESKHGKDFVPVYVRNDKTEKRREDLHASEQEIKDFSHKCHLIENNASINDLRINLKRFLDGISGLA